MKRMLSNVYGEKYSDHIFVQHKICGAMEDCVKKGLQTA